MSRHAEQVVLQGCDLPQRWRGRSRFVILDTRFGQGSKLLATWDAWRRDPQRCTRLWFIALDLCAPTVADLARAPLQDQAPPIWAELARQLLAAWPPATPDFHCIDLEQGQLRLLLAWDDPARALNELVASVDAFYLTGHAAKRPSAQSPVAVEDAQPTHYWRALHRLAAPGATLSIVRSTAADRQALGTAGFVLNNADEPNEPSDLNDAGEAACFGHFAPRHVASAPPGRQTMGASQGQRAVVIGAGLAGAAAAQALARQGIATLVLDRHGQPAQGTSGNAGGLYHGVVHGADGAHARWLRAAALLAHRHYSPLVAAQRIAGQTQGLVRSVHSGRAANGSLQAGISNSGSGSMLDGIAQAGCMADSSRSAVRAMWTEQAMREALERQALPAQWAQALDATQATRLSGVPWTGPAWLFPHAGWVSPPELVRHWLTTEGVQWRGGAQVQQLRWRGPGWQMIDASGQVIAESEIVVLANAADALRLLGHAPGDWQQQRGQVSELSAPGHGLNLPLAGAGYVIDLGGERLLFGATSQPVGHHINGDHDGASEDPTPRQADHAENLAGLRRLTGWTRPLQATSGRVGWRLQTSDRLPWIGPAPWPELAPGPRRDQPRFVPRQPGLYLLTGLGSRGLTHAPLAAELLASWITGAPMPVPSRLVDAVDVARHAARAARQQSGRN